MKQTSEVARALKAMREQAGFSVRAIAQAIGMPASTYATYENDFKQRYLPVKLIKPLAPILAERGIELVDIWKLTGVQPASMIEGLGSDQSEFNGDDAPPPKLKPQPGMAAVDELGIEGANSAAGALNPYADTHDQSEYVVARWQMPTSVIRAVSPAPIDRIKIVTAKGDSNKPEIMPGDKLMVDTTDCNPSEPGFFALWDDGQLIKRLEPVPYSNPRMVRMISANPDKEAYPTREYILEDLIINGRIIGKWERL